MSRVLVFGGRGFVGSAICDELVSRGVPCTIIGRTNLAEPRKGVDFHRGDALDPSTYRDLLKTARGVVISIGVPPWTFDRELSLRMNGTSNTTILEAAKETEVPKVVLINADVPPTLPHPIATYRAGKAAAEAAARALPAAGVCILKPSVVNGVRYEQVGTLSVPIPLPCIFVPMRFVLIALDAPCTWLMEKFESLRGLLVPPVHVGEVANAVADAIDDPSLVAGTVKVCGPKSIIAGYSSALPE